MIIKESISSKRVLRRSVFKNKPHLSTFKQNTSAHLINKNDCAFNQFLKVFCSPHPTIVRRGGFAIHQVTGVISLSSAVADLGTGSGGMWNVIFEHRCSCIKRRRIIVRARHRCWGVSRVHILRKPLCHVSI